MCFNEYPIQPRKQIMGGIIATIISSELFLKFLSTLFEEKIKEIIKKKDSKKIAADRIYILYQSLCEVEKVSIERIQILSNYLKLIKNKKDLLEKDDLATIEIVDEATLKIRELGEQILKSISKLMESLDLVSPQIEIHNYELYKSISQLKKSKYVYLEFEDDALDFLLESKENKDYRILEKMIRQEKKIWKAVNHQVSEMREFIKDKIPFQESF